MPTIAHHANGETHRRAGAGAGEEPLYLRDGAHVILAHAINHEAALDSGVIGGAIGFDRGDQDASALRIAERVGQVRRQVLQLQAEKPLGVRVSRTLAFGGVRLGGAGSERPL